MRRGGQRRRNEEDVGHRLGEMDAEVRGSDAGVPGVEVEGDEH